MRIFKNKKGVARVIESIIATILLMSCLAFIPAQAPARTASVSLVSVGQNALLSLDSEGQLAKLINNDDWNDLQSSVASTLPPTVWYNLTVFDSNMNRLNTYSICDGGATSNKIASLNYVCVSPGSNYAVYILRLQLSEVGVT